jgi:hypothetical protein
MKFKLIALLFLTTCSIKGKNKCFTKYQSIHNQTLVLGCNNTIQYTRPNPECKLTGHYQNSGNNKETNGIIWYIEETCTGDTRPISTTVYCYLAPNPEFINFGCVDLGINQTFYKVN